jgi:branched-chain amino acid transport system substrate-binding protein
MALTKRGNELLGHPVELQQENDACTGEGGANAALRVVADPQVLGLFGTVCSGSAVEASPIMSEAGLVMISANNQASELTAVGGVPGSAWQPGYYRTVYNGAALSEAAAHFTLDKLGVTKVAMIDDGTATTTGFTDAFKQIFTALGGEIELYTAVASGDTDMKPVLTAIANAKPELLFISLRGQEGVPLLQQMKEVPGTEDMILLSTATMYDDDELIGMGDDALGLHLTIPASLSGPAVDQIVADYEAAYDMARPSRDQFIFAYDGANLLLDAIEAVAVQEKDGTLHVGRQALRDALYATAGYEGVSGSLTCDQYGDCAFAEFSIWRADNPAAGIEGLQVVYTYTSGE